MRVHAPLGDATPTIFESATVTVAALGRTSTGMLDKGWDQPGCYLFLNPTTVVAGSRTPIFVGADRSLLSIRTHFARDYSAVRALVVRSSVDPFTHEQAVVLRELLVERLRAAGSVKVKNDLSGPLDVQGHSDLRALGDHLESHVEATLSVLRVVGVRVDAGTESTLRR